MLDHFKQFPDLAVSLQIAELGKSCHELLPQLQKNFFFKSQLHLGQKRFLLLFCLLT